MAILLLAEHDNSALKDATHKSVTAAIQIGGPVHILVAGTGCKSAAEEAAKIEGVEKVLVADAPAYEHNLAEPLAALITGLADGYDVLMAPATTTGKNVMPRVAALLDVRGQPTKVGELIDRLIWDTWRTDTTVTTDELGNVRLDVYAGTYEISAEMTDGTTAQTDVYLPRSNTERLVALQPLSLPE